MIRLLIGLFVLSLGVFAPSYAAADKAPVYTSWRDNIALSGYDAVSFFSGKPQEGQSKYSTDYKGAKWYFQTQANRDLFRANPTAFEPQYGGYCAWAVAKGKLAKGSPKHWFVEDGKLYLNFNKRIKARWLADKDDFISSAKKHWPKILE